MYAALCMTTIDCKSKDGKRLAFRCRSTTLTGAFAALADSVRHCCQVPD